jgi:hypothetical protein
MKRQGKWLSLGAVLLLSIMTITPTAFSQAQHVSWDIASINPPTDLTLNQGG